MKSYYKIAIFLPLNRPIREAISHSSEAKRALPPKTGEWLVPRLNRMRSESRSPSRLSRHVSRPLQHPPSAAAAITVFGAAFAIAARVHAQSPMV
jgi:hypothetical protein